MSEKLVLALALPVTLVLLTFTQGCTCQGKPGAATGQAAPTPAVTPEANPAPAQPAPHADSPPPTTAPQGTTPVAAAPGNVPSLSATMSAVCEELADRAVKGRVDWKVEDGKQNKFFTGSVWNDVSARGRALSSCAAQSAHGTVDCDSLGRMDAVVDCRAQRQLALARDAKKSNEWRFPDGAFEECKKQLSRSECEQARDAVRSREPGRCPAGAAHDACLAYACDDVTKCPEGSPCKSDVTRQALIQSGGLAAVAQQGTEREKLFVAGLLGDEGPCAQLAKDFRRVCGAAAAAIPPATVPPPSGAAQPSNAPGGANANGSAGGAPNTAAPGAQPSLPADVKPAAGLPLMPAGAPPATRLPPVVPQKPSGTAPPANEPPPAGPAAAPQAAPPSAPAAH